MRTNRRAIRGLLFATLFINSIGFSIVIPILPYLARELGADSFEIGILASSYAVVQFLITPFWGRLSDRHGRKPILLVGILGLSLSFFLMGLSPNFFWLLAARVLGGFLAAATIPTAQALAADLSTPDERAQAMGQVGAALGLGFVFGPLIAGGLVPLGLAMPFWVGGGIALVNASWAMLALKEPSGRVEAVPVKTGNVALALKALRGPHAIFILASSVVFFGQSTVFSNLALYLADRYAADEVQAGLAFGLQGLVAVALQLFAVGPLVSRFGEYRIMLFALLLGFTGFAMLALAPNFIMAVLATILSMTALSFARPAVGSAVSRSGVGFGTSMGVLASFESLGRAVGPIWAGTVYSVMISGPYLSTAALFLIILLFAARPLLKSWKATAVARMTRAVKNPSRGVQDAVHLRNKTSILGDHQGD